MDFDEFDDLEEKQEEEYIPDPYDLFKGKTEAERAKISGKDLFASLHAAADRAKKARLAEAAGVRGQEEALDALKRDLSEDL